MKKKEILLVCFVFQLFFLCLATESLAQNASKQINTIKRNETYLFEEASAATAKEAKELAIVKLAMVLADYMKEKNPEGAAKLDDFKDLAEGAKEIVTDRGKQKRVFLYYSKHDIDATAEEASEMDAPETQETEEPMVPIVQQPSPTPTQKPEPVVKQPEQTKSIESNSSIPVSDDSLAEWQRKLLGNFLKDGLTLLSAKDLVNTYKIENKIKRFGSKTNPPANAGQAFYVFADETGKVVAVLGRDNGGKRLNYVSGNYESISDYNSQNFIWFTINK